MPLAREVDYWEGVAHKCIDQNVVTDNVWKRPHQLRRLLKYDWLHQNVLEIGIGNAMVAGTLNVAVQGHWKYIGTELAPHFRKAAKDMFHLNTVEADVRELPGEGYTRIIALDSLEHVRPEHRKAGYAKIASVAAKDAFLFIHYSFGQSYHDKEFDHPFGLSDIVEIEEAGFALVNYERYLCETRDVPIQYAFVVMQKR